MIICHNNCWFAVFKGQSLSLVKHHRTGALSVWFFGFCFFFFGGGDLIKEAQIGHDLPECNHEDTSNVSVRDGSAAAAIAASTQDWRDEEWWLEERSPCCYIKIDAAHVGVHVCLRERGRLVCECVCVCASSFFLCILKTIMQFQPAEWNFDSSFILRSMLAICT